MVLASPLQRADPGGVFLLERFHAVRERDELFVGLGVVERGLDRGSSFFVFPEQGPSVAVAPAVQHVQREAGEEVRGGSIRWRSSERRRAFPRGCADLGGARAVVVEEGARGVGVEEDAEGERALRRGERVVPVASRVRAGGRRPGQRRRVVVFSRVVGHHPRQPLGHRAHAVGDERHPHRW